MISNAIAGSLPASRRTATIALSLLALLCAPGVEAQPSEKNIGFSVQVYTDGFISSTVAKISVTQVNLDSQALAAGVAVGDELVKIQEAIVPGNSAFKLKEHMAFVPGVPKKESLSSDRPELSTTLLSFALASRRLATDDSGRELELVVFCAPTTAPERGS